MELQERAFKSGQEPYEVLGGSNNGRGIPGADYRIDFAFGQHAHCHIQRCVTLLSYGNRTELVHRNGKGGMHHFRQRHSA